MSAQPDVAIVDSGGANIASVMFALERLGVQGALTADPEIITQASHVIFPGVGAAGTAMKTLQKQELTDCLKSLTQPVIGLCLGMQLLFDYSEENDTQMLGLIPGNLAEFNDTHQTVPHMGWNSVAFASDHPLLKNLGTEPYFYFVHSYYAPVTDHTIGTCAYGTDFTAIAAKDNFMGCQFHPERSSTAGAKVLGNFLKL